jgi:hypothetical protein
MIDHLRARDLPIFIRSLVILFPFFVACSCEKPSAEDRFDAERRKVVHHALKNFIKHMEIKGFCAAGIGEGLDHSNGKQNYIGVTFEIEILPDIDFARRIEVEAIQEFLNCINVEEGIQNYVAEYPYPLKFTYIAFIGREREKGLFSVANFRDEIYYNQDPPENPLGPSVEIHQESYEDGLRILAEQKAQS